MKQGPDFARIEENMRIGTQAVHGFMGTDHRTLTDVIREDQLRLKHLGIDNQTIAERMRYFTELGKQQMGTAFVVDGRYQVETDEHKGSIPCPFAHNYQADKCNTRLTCLRTGRTIVWSDLNIHLIEEHGFFEGSEAPFRIDPQTIVELLGIDSTGGED